MFFEEALEKDWDLNGIYFLPRSHTQAAIDGFYILKYGNMDCNRIILVQVTVAKTHPIEGHGLVHLYEALFLQLKFSYGQGDLPLREQEPLILL